jgi:hypothetical protein
MPGALTPSAVAEFDGAHPGNISIVLRMESLFALDRKSRKSFIGQMTTKNSKAENFDSLRSDQELSILLAQKKMFFLNSACMR